MPSIRSSNIVSIRASNIVNRRARASLAAAALLAACICCLCGFASAGVADAAAPWWHVSPTARPTLLKPGAASPGVEEISVHATGGTLFFGETESGPRFASVQFGASAEELEHALSKVYPERAVSVAKVKETKGETLYVVTFPGQSVPPIAFFPSLLELEVKPGEVLEGEVTVKQLSTGKSDGQVVIQAANIGNAAVNQEIAPIDVAAKLPPGIEPVKIEETVDGNGSGVLSPPPASCAIAGLTCTVTSGPLPIFGQIELRVDVVVRPTATSGETIAGEASGGGTTPVANSEPIAVGPGDTPFGIQSFEARAEEAGGAPATQAGSHPFQMTTTIDFNMGTGVLNPILGFVEVEPPKLVKDVKIKLPPGLLGNPTAYPRCSLGDFEASRCPSSTALGVAINTVNEPGFLGLTNFSSPVFNVEPGPGEPARLGLTPTPETPVLIDTAVRTGGDYGVTASANNIDQVIGLVSSNITLWGTPGDHAHDGARGYGCLANTRGVETTHLCAANEEPRPVPFLQLPTSCSGQTLESSVEADPWDNPGAFQTATDNQIPALQGCENIPFATSLNVTPTASAASTPAGINLDIHVPQIGVKVATGLATADVKDTTVALPAGLALNASAANGLAACSPQQIGLSDAQPPSCPDASKIATAEVTTPLLSKPLLGSMYLATQNANPFGSLVATYLVVKDDESGVLIKLAGSVSLDPLTGQATSTFANTPQLPFEDLKLRFFGGERASFLTPTHCGGYTTNASFTPWSETAPLTALSTFTIASGIQGSSCPGAALPFSPTLVAGTLSTSAGAFGPLTTTIGRGEGQQELQQVQIHTPAGLSGILSHVQLCPEAQANEGTCGAESQIGETTVAAGAGNSPVTITGKVYLSEKYAGAPFGLSIVTPAKAGPFDLEHDTANPGQQPACDCLVVRARIDVDPTTAELTITTDAAGAHAIPRMIDGVPVQIKSVNVTITRPGFTFNPTSCEPLSIAGALGGTEGASSQPSSPFHVTNCAALQFHPSFSASTQGNGTFNRGGASLNVKIATNQGPQSNPAASTEANIAKVNVALPVQLPSRLTTLQKACTEKQFAANPAGCPKESNVGTATARTPVLPVPLTGPAYLVSHGNAAFPDLVLILQGYGVTIVLTGHTDIKKGITYSRFETVPDAPVSSFELNLPEGKFSALAANGNLCKTAKTVTVNKRVAVRRNGRVVHVLKRIKTQVATPLSMPTTITAQNGAVLTQTTKIAVTGCGKATAKTKPAKKAHAPRRARKHGH